MKKIFAIAAAMLLTVASFAQNGKSIYTKYSDAENVSVVYISPAMFKLMGKLPDMDMGESEVNLSSIIKSLNGFYLIDSRNKDVNEGLRSDAEKFVKKGNYELLMEVKDSGEIIRMYTVGNEKIVTSFIMLAYDNDGYTFICMDGQISREDLEKNVRRENSK